MSLNFPEIVTRLQLLLPESEPVYLVGGAVRDAFLQRTIHDLDFTLGGDVLAVARRLARELNAAYYPLDEARETARLICETADGSRLVLDFAALRGPDLESDLRGRDFTVNALAVPLHALHQLIDPLNGLEDLRQKRLRLCSDNAILDDPLRAVRGIRLANEFGWRMLPETRQQIRQGLPELKRISPERLRDELFNILDSSNPAPALDILERLGGLPSTLPELASLKEVEQASPHISNVWRHTLDVLKGLDALLACLGLEHDPLAPTSFYLGLASVRLGRYRQQFHDHMQTRLNPTRSQRSLLLLAALYHDCGKPETRQVLDSGRVRFLEHELRGAEIVSRRGQALRLSNDEIEHLTTIVRQHMRPLLLSQADAPVSRRAIYRFFRDSGPAGVEICLHSLADCLATYGPTLTQDVWVRQLDVCRSLLEAWWERPQESVAPATYLNGHELIAALGLEPGPLVGQLLDELREAQAIGTVTSRQQALDYARRQRDESLTH